MKMINFKILTESNKEIFKAIKFINEFVPKKSSIENSQLITIEFINTIILFKYNDYSNNNNCISFKCAYIGDINNFIIQVNAKELLNCLKYFKNDTGSFIESIINEEKKEIMFKYINENENNFKHCKIVNIINNSSNSLFISQESHKIKNVCDKYTEKTNNCSSISQPTLFQLINKVDSFVGNSPRNNLECILFKFDNFENFISLISCNTRVLAIARENDINKVNICDRHNMNILIYYQTILKIKKILNTKDYNHKCIIDIYISDKSSIPENITFYIDDICIKTNVFQGEYIKYESYIPTEYPNFIVDLQNKKKLISILKDCKKLISFHDRHPLKILIHEKNINITMESKKGKISNTVENCVSPTCINKQLGGYNCNYLWNIFKTIKNEYFKIYFYCPLKNKPITINSVNDKFFYLVMPIILKDYTQE